MKYGSDQLGLFLDSPGACRTTSIFLVRPEATWSILVDDATGLNAGRVAPDYIELYRDDAKHMTASVDRITCCSGVVTRYLQSSNPDRLRLVAGN